MESESARPARKETPMDKTRPGSDELQRQSQMVGEQCICYAARKISRGITQLYDHHLQAAGLRITQFTLLNAIAAFGSVQPGRLADELLMDRSSLTRNLQPLIKQQWVEYHVDAKDRRAKRLRLTAAGRARLAAARPLWQAAQKDAERLIDGQVLARLSRSFADAAAHA